METSRAAPERAKLGGQLANRSDDNVQKNQKNIAGNDGGITIRASG